MEIAQLKEGHTHVRTASGSALCLWAGIQQVKPAEVMWRDLLLCLPHFEAHLIHVLPPPSAVLLNETPWAGPKHFEATPARRMPGASGRFLCSACLSSPQLSAGAVTSKPQPIQLAQKQTKWKKSIEIHQTWLKEWGMSLASGTGSHSLKGHIEKFTGWTTFVKWMGSIHIPSWETSFQSPAGNKIHEKEANAILEEFRQL